MECSRTKKPSPPPSAVSTKFYNLQFFLFSNQLHHGRRYYICPDLMRTLTSFGESEEFIGTPTALCELL
jgi:hypothetical protein